MMDFTISPLTAERWAALEDLFGRAGASNGCWCMYWRIGPGYRDRPRADNKRDLRRLAASGQPPGLLAFGEVPGHGAALLATQSRPPSPHGWDIDAGVRRARCHGPGYRGSSVLGRLWERGWGASALRAVDDVVSRAATGSRRPKIWQRDEGSDHV
jgi:hypothetical protein